MGTTAEFHGVAIQLTGFTTNLHDANDVAVFVAKELCDVFAALDIGVLDFGP